MSRSDELRRRATVCRDLASRALSPGARRGFQEAADAFHEAAKNAELALIYEDRGQKFQRQAEEMAEVYARHARKGSA